MTRLRRVLAPVAAIWLCCQVGTLALAPVALWITAADPHGVECTCGHGDGAMCPMHHKPTNESGTCAMQAANLPGSAILAAIIGIAGLVPGSTVSIGPAIVSKQAPKADIDVDGRRPIPPDPPPPRA
jgi:hypothetical protein